MVECKPMRNYYESNGDTVTIKLRCSRCGWLTCKIDARDLQTLLAIRTTWSANPARKSACRKHYAFARVYSNGTGKGTLMHRVILNPPAGREVNHKDNDGLNNRRDNLNILSHIENMRWDNPDNDWADVDRRRALAKEYRTERAIACKIQIDLVLTRQALWKIRNGRTRTSPAAILYADAIKAAGIRSYEVFKRDHVSARKWGAVRGSK